MQKQFILFILLSILVAIFAITNADIMNVQLFLWSFEMSGSLVILLSVALGALLVLLFGLYRKFKTRKAIKEYEKTISNLKSQQEILITQHQKTLQENEVLKAELNELQNSQIHTSQQTTITNQTSEE